jgi:CHAT domain-containing protein
MDDIDLAALSDLEFQAWLADTPISLTLDCVEALKGLAEGVSEMGILQRAVSILTLAQGVAEKLSDSRAQGLVWRGWANVYQRHNLFAESLHASERSAQAYQILGDEREVAKSRILEVHCLGTLGRFQESAALAVQLKQTLHDFPLALAFIHHNQAQVYSWEWRFSEAFAEYRQAEEIFRAIDRLDCLASLKLDTGCLLAQLDDLSAARQSFDEAYHIALEENDIYTAYKSRYNQAGLFGRQLLFNQGLACIFQAKEIAEQMDDPAEFGYVLLEEASLRMGLGQRDQARQLLTEALYRFDHPGFLLDKVIVLAELSQLLVQSSYSEDLLQGLHYLTQASAFLAEQPVPAIQALIAVHQAEYLLRLKREGEAVNYLESARAIFQDLNLPLRLAWTEAALGDCFFQTEPTRANDHYQTSLALGAGDLPLLATRCWQGLARIEFANKNYDQAILFYQSALRYMIQVRQKLTSHAYQAGFNAGKADLVDELLNVLLRQNGPPFMLFRWVERSKAWILADLLSSAPITCEAESQLQTLLTERENLQREFDRQVNKLMAVSGDQPPAVQRNRAALQILERHLSVDMVCLRNNIQAVQEKIDLLSGNPLCWQEDETEQLDIHALLDPGCIYISYAAVNQKLIAITATHTPGDLQLHELDVTLPEIEHHLAFIRVGGGGEEKIAAYKLWQRLNWLYRHLLQPFEDRLADKEHLIISPFGCLSLVPFAALGLDSGGWLVERWKCSLVPNGKSWASIKQEEASAAPPILIGYPGLPGDKDYLPGVEKELDALAEIFPQAGRLYGEAATFEKVIENLPDRSLVHIAGHAWFGGEQPLESGMPLAGERWLRASDLYLRRNILSGSLVMLSGCDTGIGNLTGGEVLGLNSAFLYAGASGILSGLWKVDDAMTARLIECFYRHLLETRDPASALHLAQCDFIHNEATSHPFYWAAFQLIGGNPIYIGPGNTPTHFE